MKQLAEKGGAAECEAPAAEAVAEEVKEEVAVEAEAPAAE